MEPGGDVADRANDLEVLLVRAVGEVEAEDVDPGLDEPLEGLGAAGGRSDGGDDLRPAHGVTSIKPAPVLIDTPFERTL